MPSLNKKEQILATASEMFIKNGFAKVSMEAIAAAVPVSKPTLYNNFSDKKELFAAVVRSRCNKLAADMEESIREGNEPEIVLRDIGCKFLNMLLTPEALKIHRIMVAECAEFPEMAKLFYKTGPQRIQLLLEEYLKSQHETNKLNVENAYLSAAMFLSSLKSYVHMESLLSLRKTCSVEERDKIIDYSIKLFLKAHKN